MLNPDASTTVETPDSASAGYMREKLENARQALINSKFYLGVPTAELQPKLTWDRVGRVDHVVSVEAAEAAEVAFNAFYQANSDLDERKVAPVAAEPAILSAVVKISEEDYWLTSCGMWREPSPITPTLADVKPTCVGVVPPHAVFANDFRNVLNNVKMLMNMEGTRGMAQRKGVLVKNHQLRFRHVLFEPVRKSEGSSENSTSLSSSSELPPQFTIAGWPAFYAQAREELKKMVDTHRVNHLDAFDEQGHLIEPADYRKRLQGALVLIRFTLNHWAISERAGQPPCDTFAATICSMRVLAPSASFSQSNVPQKRKFHKTDPFTPDISPKSFKIFAKSSASVKQTIRDCLKAAVDMIPIDKLTSICIELLGRLDKSKGRRSKNCLFDALATSEITIQRKAISMCQAVVAAGEGRYGPKRLKKRLARSSEDSDVIPRKRTHRCENAISEMEDWKQQTCKVAPGDFMRPPTMDQCQQIVQKFITHTNNAALATAVCAVCARETRKNVLEQIKVTDIPNPKCLKPSAKPPPEKLLHGMLLERAGISPCVNNQTENCRAGEEKNLIVNVCTECLRRLHVGQTPSLSLANSMWIGKIPFCLSTLTLPEQILIAKYYVAAFIVKLYPKQQGSAFWDQKGMQKGFRGNISTYQLDPLQVADMVDGKTLPPPLKILSAMIGVTFVTPKGSPEPTMPEMFRVRRERVRAALFWLKKENPLYANIDISHQNLDALPDDDVPLELTVTAQVTNDIGATEKEQNGYVPFDEEIDDDLESRMAEAGLFSVENEQNRIFSSRTQEHLPEAPDSSCQPPVIALNSHIIADVEGAHVTDSELMTSALLNTASQKPPTESYNFKRGGEYVNEYPHVDKESGQRSLGEPNDPNHLLGSFPALFPYGLGGFETERCSTVPYETHVRWALRYHDRRFRKCLPFIFLVFSVIQKRQACRSAVLQLSKATYQKNKHLIDTLKPEDLIQASDEERRGVAFSNPAMRILRHQLKAIRTRVTGSDESRFSARSKIWGTTVAFGPPSIWITLNPAESHDPIAQVLTGQDIDLDDVARLDKINASQRAINMASDPFAAAEYFHFMITTMLEVVFGIKSVQGRVSREMGAIGKIQAYVGMVEAQGRGTLHLHLLLWLTDALNAQELREALQGEIFRNHVRTFVARTIRADIDGLNDEEVNAIPPQRNVGYNRPVNPENEIEAATREKLTARTVQYHKCRPNACLVVIKNRLMCKRRAPFPTASDNWVNANGEWGPKRTCKLLNNWNPIIMRTLQANHDIKLILQGACTTAITWYITNYATKKQAASHNTSALMAKKFLQHFEESAEKRELYDHHKKLIERCAIALTFEREFGAPEIISYLMGWGDRYESHCYSIIFLDAITYALKRSFPTLRDERVDIANEDDDKCEQSNAHISVSHPRKTGSTDMYKCAKKWSQPMSG
ncbi:hypothetical protein M378DRAFT_21881 [Amanita muscaria Koide BX008]|uniref:Uncharacterized protein n=1 Tax=Amanita muscaria (strain Koide BX008) TaxID=946122 RepID=A0A0C2XFX7_AMAMK|nr:hypothetical protein M378DRAFT_21881 [Amanita muscaria Koide BX008]